ncbi:MAG: preprotein translocase subunit SecA [Methylacidiphilales bacterium]|nr:preprotein translocase subunit SecA [Candidatus Methylacidiphilales bacterium]
MFRTILSLFLLNRNQRQIKRYQAIAEKIDERGKSLLQISDDALKQLFQDTRANIQQGATLESQMVEVFAIVREASTRVLGMRHFIVQLIGGIALHEGNIGEMKTGEGKTLTATLPAALNALTGKGVHIVTVNDYLATRDANWMGKLFTFLGFSVSSLTTSLSDQERKLAYQSDILYAVNNELGFDYLRDNMKLFREHQVQRPFNYAIIDEVDSVLIDEARTPLIISGQTNEPSELYTTANQLVKHFVRQENEEDVEGDYFADEKSKRVHLSDAGHAKAELLYQKNGVLAENENLYFQHNLHLIHHLESALCAHAHYVKDTDYVVQNQKVILVDEFTGRLMHGRRLSHGLHQAIEAKELVPILPNSQTLASITFQNFFKNYPKLAGMTGTADTEAQELYEIYSLEVVVIPTNKAMIRKDLPDLVFLDKKSKYQAIVNDVFELYQKGQPVLVGTASIETSEELSILFKQKSIPHEVLNAKKHDREAIIIAQAGRLKAVTIATNMAGRGTDIILGGNPSLLQDNQLPEVNWQEQHNAVVGLGGLHIIGSERHESRRVDNQLRGRSGRQGDPGTSRFYLSLEDNLLRIFASENVSKLMQWIGFQPGQSIEHPLLSKTIESAQRKVEVHNFQLRKNLLEYDTISNDQRKVIYGQRSAVLEKQNLEQLIEDIVNGVIDQLISSYAPETLSIEDWHLASLEQVLEQQFFIKASFVTIMQEESFVSIRDTVTKLFNNEMQKKRESFGQEQYQNLLRQIMLIILDKYWKDHLINLEELMRGIHLRGYASKNPKHEYKREAFELFVKLLEQMRFEIVGVLMQPIIKHEQLEEINTSQLQTTHQEASLTESPKSIEEVKKISPIVSGDKVQRNDPCPCGSGLKYKKCHGKV